MDVPRALPRAGAESPKGPHNDPGRRSAVRLGGDRLVRVVWAGVAVPAIGLLVASLPPFYAHLRTVCTAGECDDHRLTPEGMQALRELGLSLDFYAAYTVALAVLFAGVCLALSGVLVWRAAGERMALFVSLMLVLIGVLVPQAPRALLAAHPAWHWPIQFLGFLGFASVPLFINLFPSGRFVPRWTRWAALVWVTLDAHGFLLPGSPIHANRWLSALDTLVFVGVATASLGGLVYRYRRASSPVQRQQIKWVVCGTTAGFGSFLAVVVLSFTFPAPGIRGLLATLGMPSALVLGVLLIPLSIGVAILRYRLWDIDLLINRTMVYGALTLSVIAIYVLVVGYLGALFRTGGNLAVSLVATGVVAVLFQPLRERLQRGANRLLYGERDEPYAVLSRLGRRLEATIAPEAVLPTITRTVTEALKLPYAAIALRQDGEFATVAATGTPLADPVRLPLVYQQEPVGALLLAPRAPSEGFSPADRRLLDDLARQAGVAVHAVRLTRDLERARERLVAAREEERRRLRRDLHDGLGPALGAQMLKLGSARALYPHDPAAADALLAELEHDLGAALADIRRLVYNLRPPALDDLGLAGAIRQASVQYDGSGNSVNGKGSGRLSVTVEVPERLPPLPAAVEVAAYRIAQEALTNVMRHARARSCTIRLALDGASTALRLEIADDGVGLPTAPRAGVGLASMRERAEELGGACTIESPPGGGTRVLARLPVSPATGEPGDGASRGEVMPADPAGAREG